MPRVFKCDSTASLEIDDRYGSDFDFTRIDATVRELIDLVASDELIDINSSEVQFSRSGDALLLSVRSTGDAITVNFQFWGDQGVTNVKFADGTIWNRSAISNAVSTFTWTGNSSNPTLTGNDYGSNIFQLGGGSEVAMGVLAFALGTIATTRGLSFSVDLGAAARSARLA